MSLGDQPPGGIHNDRPTVGRRLFINQLVGLALPRETKCFIGDQLVGAKTVMQLADVDLLGPDLCLLIGHPGGLFGHVGADDFHAVGVLGEGRCEVGDHRLADYLNRLLQRPWSSR